MEHKFQYSHKCACGHDITWSGTWEILRLGDETEELCVKSRGRTYNVIIGSGVVTDYVCIPDHDAGFRLESLEDIVSNTEHLNRHFSPEESCLIAAALKDYAEN